MGRFVAFLTVLIVLAIFQTLLAALAVGLAMALLYSFVTRPMETLGFMGMLLLFGLASAAPAACVVAIAAGASVLILARQRLKGRRRGRSLAPCGKEASAWTVRAPCRRPLPSDRSEDPA